MQNYPIADDAIYLPRKFTLAAQPFRSVSVPFVDAAPAAAIEAIPAKDQLCSTIWPPIQRRYRAAFRPARRLLTALLNSPKALHKRGWWTVESSVIWLPAKTAPKTKRLHIDIQVERNPGPKESLFMTVGRQSYLWLKATRYNKSQVSATATGTSLWSQTTTFFKSK